MVDFQSRERRTRGGNGDDDNGDTDTDESESAPGEDEKNAAEADIESSGDGPAAGVAVVTIADDQTIEADQVGDAVVAALEGHELVTREILGRSHDNVQQAVDNLVNRRDVDAVVTVGGTGVDPDDITIEAVHPLFKKAMPGFGELFRRHYFETAGTDMITTRATAGIADGTPVFCLPGSVDAARLGTSEIVSEQVGRLADSGADTSV